MGEVPSVQALTTAAGMSDRDVLNVINPPASDRDRSSRLDATYSLESAYKESSKMLPAHAEWRTTPKIGKVLNPATQIIRSNHFAVNTRSLKSSIQKYLLTIFKIDRAGIEDTVDAVNDEDQRVVTSLVLQLRDNHPEWRIGTGVGFTFNGRSVLYTSELLPLTSVDRNGAAVQSEIIHIKKVDGSQSGTKYRVTLTFNEVIILPHGPAEVWSRVTDDRIIAALDAPLLSFARWGIVEDNPEWFTVGQKAFRSTGEVLSLSPTYNAQKGYYASLKVCLAGLVLVSDMSVSCFLAGGPMIDFMWHCAGYRSLDDMLQDSKGKGIPKQRMDKIAESIKGAKVRVTHLGHFRKAKALGPPANSKESTFSVESVAITVADYYAKMAKVHGSLYKTALPSGALKYPSLPCINMGSLTKPVYIPAELIDIPGGQCRSQVCTPDMTAKMITVCIYLFLIQ